MKIVGHVESKYYFNIIPSVSTQYPFELHSKDRDDRPAIWSFTGYEIEQLKLTVDALFEQTVEFVAPV